MATIKDVAACAGLSPSVVSKYLKDSSSVRPDTRQRIESAIAELNYTPTLIARAMRTGRTNMILIVIPEIEDRKANELINHLQNLASKHGFTIVLCTEQTLRRLYSSQSKNAISAYPVDGILFCYPADPKVICRFAKELNHVPRVVIGFPLWEDTSTYLWNVNESAYLLTRHLIEQKHERIGYIGSHPKNQFFKANAGFNREAAFRKALMDTDTPLYESLLYLETPTDSRESLNYAMGIRGAEFLLNRPKPPTAIICENDATAVACVNYALSKNLKIPEDIAIGSCEDSIRCRTSYPPITAGALPIMAVAELAMNKLIAIINHTDNGKVEMIIPAKLPITLHIRHSTEQSQPDILTDM